jgi:hypothetical protein
MKHSRIAARVLPGLFFLSVLSGVPGANPAQAQETKPCYLKTGSEKGTILTIVQSDGSATPYGPEQDALTKAEEIINAEGLGPCEELPAPSIPFDSSGIGIAAVTVAAFGVVVRRKRQSTADAK